MRSKPIPKTESELIQTLTDLYRQLVGEVPVPGGRTFVEKYDGYGMSAGFVCADFWLDKGFPLLVQRFKILKDSMKGRTESA